MKKVNAKLPKLALVSHGSSSVPQELTDKINKYGGDMPGARGVPVEQLVESIEYGVRKINIDTDLRMAATAAIREVFAETPAVFDMRAYLKPAIEAMSQVVEDRMVSFRTAGKAKGIGEPVSLKDVAAAYAQA